MTCWYHTTPSKLCDKCMDDERRKAAAAPVPAWADMGEAPEVHSSAAVDFAMLDFSGDAKWEQRSREFTEEKRSDLLSFPDLETYLARCDAEDACKAFLTYLSAFGGPDYAKWRYVGVDLGYAERGSYAEFCARIGTEPAPDVAFTHALAAEIDGATEQLDREWRMAMGLPANPADEVRFTPSYGARTLYPAPNTLVLTERGAVVPPDGATVPLPLPAYWQEALDSGRMLFHDPRKPAPNTVTVTSVDREKGVLTFSSEPYDGLNAWLRTETAVRDEVAAKRHNLKAKLYDEACEAIAAVLVKKNGEAVGLTLDDYARRAKVGEVSYAEWKARNRGPHE